jgi:flagellar hook-associated protein 2
MSSPITFSGFNDIDFNLILNALMDQASQPLNALRARQTGAETQIKTYGTLTTKLLALRDAADRLGDATQVNTLKGTSSDAAAVSVSTGTTAVAGRYDVVVNSLARAQVTVTASSAPDANTTVVASGGSLTIGGVAVAIAGDVTLQQLADTINGTEGIGVTAVVVRTATDTHRLVLTSSQTGTDHAFTVVNTLTGGTGVAFPDTDLDGTTGDSLEDNAVNASNASILFNNIEITNSANTFEHIVSGTTLTVFRADPAATIRVDVAANPASLKADVEAFVTAYNDFVTFQTSQREAAAAGNTASISRDPLLRSLQSSLRSSLLASHGSATFTRLSEVGVEFTTTGTLKLNSAKFDEAVANDGDAVRALFTAADGVFPAVEDMIKEYTQANGFIANVTTRLKAQVESVGDQVAQMQGRLALQRESLLRQFIEADLAMSRLREQSNSLAGLGAGFGLL